VTSQETAELCVFSGGRYAPSGTTVSRVSRGKRANVYVAGALGLLVAFGNGVAGAQSAGQTIHSQSLRAPSPQPQLGIERELRDLYAITEEEGIGYFEEQDRRRRRHAFIGHYRKATLRKVRDWSLDLVPGEWSEGEASTVSGEGAGASGASVGGGGWATRFVDQVINETDVELRYGGGDGLAVLFGRDLELHGPDWLRGSRVEVSPITGEVEVDFDLRSTSLSCGLSTGGAASISWSIPF
jgi:hypothetical protein